MASEKDILKDAQEQFHECAENETENRTRWVDDTRFAMLGDQWPADVLKSRERDRRPALTFNRLNSFIRQVVNECRSQRPSIRVLPVGDGSDKATAKILSGLIRNIEVRSMADVAYDTAVEHACSGGFGYFRVGVEWSADDSFDTDIVIQRIMNPLTVYGDPKSIAADSSDWDLAFVTDVLTDTEFERRWGKKQRQASFTDGESSQDWDDDDGIRIAEYWVRDEVKKKLLLLPNMVSIYEDEYLDNADYFAAHNMIPVRERIVDAKRVRQYILSGDAVLEESAWEGTYIPIIPVYGQEVIIDGKRYFNSLIHHARGAQESYNYWRTSSVEKVALDTKAPYIGPRGAFTSDPNWATSNTTNHPYLEYDGPTPPQRSQPGGVPAGDLQLAAQSADDMKAIIGIFDASLGAEGNETSGVAINARKSQGDAATFHIMDNLTRGIAHCGRILVDLIPKVYNTQRMIRILGEDGTPNNVMIGKQQQGMPMNETTMVQTSNEVIDGMASGANTPGMDHVFDLTLGKYDVVISTGASFATRRQEAASNMVELVRAYPQLAEIAGDILIKNLDWPGAEEIAERMQRALPAANGQNPQIMQLQQQLQQLTEQGKQQIDTLNMQIQQLFSENQQLKVAMRDKEAETRIKAEEMQIKKYEAETNRMEAKIKSAEAAAKIDVTRAEVEQAKAETARQFIEAAGLRVFKPSDKVKRGRAVKMPDGSWVMEAVETTDDIDSPMDTVKRGKAVQTDDGQWVFESVEASTGLEPEENISIQ